MVTFDRMLVIGEALKTSFIFNQ